MREHYILMKYKAIQRIVFMNRAITLAEDRGNRLTKKKMEGD